MTTIDSSNNQARDRSRLYTIKITLSSGDDSVSLSKKSTRMGSFFVLKWYKNGAINMLEKYKKDLSQTKLVIVDKFVPKDHLLRKIKDSLNKSRPAN